jgi:site-specific DNA-methyltransferase (adenine-specific)
MADAAYDAPVAQGLLQGILGSGGSGGMLAAGSQRAAGSAQRAASGSQRGMPQGEGAQEVDADSDGCEQGRFELANADAVSWLSQLPAQSVDLLVTDPPYESLEKHRAVGTTTRLKHSKASSNDWFPIFPNARFGELFREVYRVLKRDRHFYLFCDAETLFVAKPLAESAGFKFWKPLVWDKRKIGMGYHYRARCEFILFFEKGKRRLNDLAQPDVIEYPSIRGGYPTEKPPQVSQILVRQSTQAGELVVDPFMGSGSVGVAALAERRRFLGNDINPRALELSRARLLEQGVEGTLKPVSRSRQGVLL